MSDQDGVQADEGTGTAAPGNDTVRKTAARGGAAKPALPVTVGQELRQAREAAGLSVQDVADRTKVRPGLLALIEADDHDRLPALTYSIGFVKAYARTVGLDPIAAGERYRQESQKGDPVPTMVDMQPLDSRRMPSKRLVAAVSGLLMLVLGLFWAWGAGWLTPAAPPAPVVADAATNMPAAPEDDFADANAAMPAPVDALAQVTLTAKTEAWVKISDAVSGETFFMGTMTPAQMLSLPPGKPWVLRTGRAGALEVKVGDKAIPPLGGEAETVRALSLAPADLLAIPVPAAGGLAAVKPIDTPSDRPSDSLGAARPAPAAVAPAPAP